MEAEGSKRPQDDDGHNNSQKKIKIDKGNLWTDLEHRGPFFWFSDYEPLPKDVYFKYNNKKIQLSEKSEELAYYYAKVYKKSLVDLKFRYNFFKEWRQVMTKEEKELIKDLKKCYFGSIAAYHNRIKNKEREKLVEIQNKYGYCNIDGSEEKVKIFIIRPGLFQAKNNNRGRFKHQVMPEDVTINCSENKIPTPPTGHEWKEVKHDRTVSWLASWENNVTGKRCYMQLSEYSKLKQNKNVIKFETARKLHKYIDKIRNGYRNDWNDESEHIRQRGVALYLIDLCAFRPGYYYGNDEDEGDTVGCCSLHVEHVTLNETTHEVAFNFLGKCSVEYKTNVQVENEAFENLKKFKENKEKDDNLFDKLTTKTLNDYLQTFMPGLTAKVFRTYKASIICEKKLDEDTPKGDVKYKISFLKQVIGEVAKICNHKHTVKKNGSKKIDFANNTSINYYIDPRIIVAWCKKHNVPIEMIFSKATRDKFKRAIVESNANYKFAMPGNNDSGIDISIMEEYEYEEAPKAKISLRIKPKMKTNNKQTIIPNYFHHKPQENEGNS